MKSSVDMRIEVVTQVETTDLYLTIAEAVDLRDTLNTILNSAVEDLA